MTSATQLNLQSEVMNGSVRALPIHVVSRGLALELEALAADLAQFQHDLSDLLSAAHVSASLMRRSQSLDAATQALEALSDVARACERAAASGACDVDTDELTRLVKLGDLRHRLMGAGPHLEPAENGPQGHVNLFD